MAQKSVKTTDRTPERLAATLKLEDAVGCVPQISTARQRELERLGISTVYDLVHHFPRRYLDLSVRASVAEAKVGSSCTILGTVHSIALKRPKPKLPLVEITLTDSSGTLLITCFRQPWLMDSIRSGSTIAVSGKVDFSYGFKRMTNPFIETFEQENRETELQVGRVIPVHPASEKISAANMRRFIRNGLDAVKGASDPLPLDIRTRYRLMGRNASLECIHFPRTMDEQAQARRRLAFEEVLYLELMLMQATAGRSLQRVPTQHRIDGDYLQKLEQAIPFNLTDDQLQARRQILSALAAPACANHLLLGDVGTGKTIVCAFALAAAADTGTQSLLMAPTEVLAMQHAKSLGSLFDTVGITWELLTGSTSPADRASILQRLAAGTVDVLIGTHAILEPDVIVPNCTLCVIDEQQRFGVEQREAFLAKGPAVDALYLTATPIPRTLALAVYGDLDLSYLRQRPHNAVARTTTVLRKSDCGIAYGSAREALERGEQVYVVCPLIGIPTEAHSQRSSSEPADDDGEYAATISIESDSDYEIDTGNLSAATQEAEYLSKKIFPGYSVELLHGKMKPQQKAETMERFRAGEIQVLVSTTVIEVGVDVPNATTMIIEDADRFGLSQLHQLRGRVGRGEKPGYVYLVSASQTDYAMQRLSAMERTEDGFELASYDLSLRREGDILGNRQHGTGTLKLVNVIKDSKLIEAAHDCAKAIVEMDPTLSQPDHLALAREMRLAFKDAQSRQGG